MREGRGGPGCVQTVVRIAALVCVCAAPGGSALAQQPPPQPAQQQEARERDEQAKQAQQPTPARPRRLVLDIDKHVQQKLAEEPPRFETSIEVVARSPQMLLARFFGGVDLECGPSAGGAPSMDEMREHRPHTAPTADLLALAMALAGKVMAGVKGKPTPHYYLYAVKRNNTVSYALREDRVPDSWFYNFPGVTFELVESFPDRDSATRAWRRMERGYATPVAPKVDALASQWGASPCRARR
jgi:hypothetical protein